MKKYDAVIIDDEVGNLVLLNHFITKFCIDINIVGQADSVEMGINLINLKKPTILYLDIRLESRYAFDILDSIDFSDMEVVFVTAFEEFALKAFKYNAVDYILKPLSIEDLILATNRALKRIMEKDIFYKQLELGERKNNSKTSKYVSISSIDKVNLIIKQDIIFCKSDGRYTTFYLNNKEEYVACKNLGEYEQILVEECFFRIHHSYIVNLDYLVKINKKAGNYCEMTNGALLPIAKRRQENLNKFLNIK